MKCKYCSYEIPGGQIVCPNCDRSVDDPNTTVAIRADNILLKRLRARAETDTLSDGEPGLVLHIRGLQRRFTLEEGAEMTIGRADPGNNIYPDLDLQPFGGEQRGVSRIHARLNVIGAILMITDLNSANGTRLNGETLTPMQPAVISDGDELVLGQLAIGVNYRF